MLHEKTFNPLNSCRESNISNRSTLGNVMVGGWWLPTNQQLTMVADFYQPVPNRLSKDARRISKDFTACACFAIC
jgi:hypothetical protein